MSPFKTLNKLLNRLVNSDEYETEEDLHDVTFGIGLDPLTHFAIVFGALTHDPSSNWYIGELGFFDYYLIPLAMKLKECGVFGASGYEYISYVLKNKKEWEGNGRQVVQEMVLLYRI